VTSLGVALYILFGVFIAVFVARFWPPRPADEHLVVFIVLLWPLAPVVGACWALTRLVMFLAGRPE
jgi:hypothetical protein